MNTGLIVRTDAAANGGRCVARHDGRVVFVRGALPGERVRVRVTEQRSAYWHAEVLEVLDAAPGRVESLCPIAGVDGSGCCDLAFADPATARAVKTAVVANQLARHGRHDWAGQTEPLGDGEVLGWRTRVQLDIDRQGRPGFHRYRSDDLVTDLRCGQLPPALTDGLAGVAWPPGARLHAVLDDEGTRHVVVAGPGRRRRVADGAYHGVHRVGARTWRVPVTGFWQAHLDGPPTYSALVTEWAQPAAGETAWDLYGGAGVFAAVLAEAVGESGRVLSVDTARGASGAARAALADLPQVRVVTDSVRRALAAEPAGADVAVLDPPRTGAGRQVIELLAAAGVARVVHIGCEAASFARDVGLYQQHGYTVADVRVFDAFPLTHHVECAALLTR